MRNYVAKHAFKTNKPKVEQSKKAYRRKAKHLYSK